MFGFINYIGPLTGLLRASQDIHKDFNTKWGRVVAGTFFESITILGADTVAMLKKNENQLWNALQHVPDLPDAVRFATEDRREKILIKLYQWVLMTADLWFTVFQPAAEDADATLSETSVPLQ